MSGGQSISAIGNYGLGGTGYSSYDPTMMAMMSGYGSYGMMNPAMMSSYGMGMNPMMSGLGGMYGGSFMNQQLEMLKEYYKFQEELEKFKLEHATEMHKTQQMAEVANLSAHDQAFFLKAMEDGYVQQGIREIYDNIRSGNQDYVVKKFYELKQGIATKFSDYFNTADGAKNSRENINNLIRLLYAEIGGGFTADGTKPDLINDIKSYGENPWQHGFNKTYLGNKGHNKLNAEEALNQMFGTGINDTGSKAKAEKIGSWCARGAEVATAGVTGLAAGAAALGLTKFFTPGFITKHVPEAISGNSLVKWGTKYGTWAKGAGLAAMGLDALWQLCRD